MGCSTIVKAKGSGVVIKKLETKLFMMMLHGLVEGM